MAVTLLQQTSGSNSTNATLNVSFGSAVTAGSVVIVAIKAAANTPGFPTVSDNKSNTYTELAFASSSAASPQINTYIYTAHNVTGGSSFQVSVVNTTFSVGCSVAIYEFSGVDTASFDDVTATNHDTNIVEVQDAASASNSVAFGSNVTAGSMLCAWGTSNDPSVSVSDTLGNSYTVTVASITISNFKNLYFAFALNTSAGANTITATSGGTVNQIRIAEFGGIATSSAADAAVTNTGSGTGAFTAVTGSFTPAQDGELIIGAFHGASGITATFTAGSGFTIIQNTSLGVMEWKVQQAAASINPQATGTASGSNSWCAIGKSFKAAILAPAVPITTTVNGDLIFSSVFTDATTVPSVGASNTLLQTGNDANASRGWADEYIVQSTAGAITNQFVDTATSAHWAMASVALKPGAGGGTVTHLLMSMGMGN